MATKIIKYTGETGERKTDNSGNTLVSVGPDDQLEQVSADLADYLVANDPNYEYYVGGGSAPNNFTNVDGLDIAPDSVTTDSIETESLNSVRYAKPEDGTAGIQTAIDALPSTGGLVILEEGTYLVSDGAQYPSNAVSIDKDNVGIVGQGPSTVIKVPDGFTPADDGQKVIDIGGDAEDDRFSGPTAVNYCHLHNFAIDGNYQNQGNINPDDDGHNIEIEGSWNIVSNVWSRNSTGDGVELTSHSDPSNTQYNIVSNCIFQDCWEQDIHLHGAWNSLIIGNICDGEVNNSAIHCFSDHTDVRNCIVANNRIQNSQKWGVKVTTDASGFDVENLRLNNNIITDNSGGGIDIRGDHATNIWITGNTVRGNSGTGINIAGADKVHLIGNDVSENDTEGIKLRNDPTALGNAYVRHNWVYNNNRADVTAPGIKVESALANGITNVIFEDNEVVSDSAPLHHRPIQFVESTVGTYADIFVRNNLLKGKAGGNGVVDNSNMATEISGNTPGQKLDVTLYAPDDGAQMYHDGSGTNTAGPAARIGGSWISLVDGSTIS